MSMSSPTTTTPKKRRWLSCLVVMLVFFSIAAGVVFLVLSGTETGAKARQLRAINAMQVENYGTSLWWLVEIYSTTDSWEAVRIVAPDVIRSGPRIYGQLSEINDLDLSGSSVSLQYLNSLPALKNLSLRRVKDSAELAFLRTVPTLKKLQIAFPLQEDAIEIGKLASVENLTIGPSDIDLRPLSGMSNLKSLLLYKRKTTGLGFIAGLKNLESLSLRFDSGDTSLTLPHAPRLRYLEISDNTVLTNLSVQPGHAVEALKIRGCRNLSTLQGVTSLDKLTTLTIEHCPNLTDSASLACFSNLESLKLINVPMADLAPLLTLSRLRELEIRKCPHLKDSEIFSGLSSRLRLAHD
jgi:hypothetical protein